MAAQADRQGGAALGAGLVHRLLGHVAALDVFLDVIDALLEGLPELLQQRHPLLLAPGDGVELVLQPGGEVVVDVGSKVLGEEAVDHPPDVGGQEALLVEEHVFPFLEGGDDAGVGRGPADAELFQGLDQAGLGKARWRLGEVLFRADAQQVQLLALDQGRQLAFLVVVRLPGVVAPLQVDAHEAGGGDVGAGGAEEIARPGPQVDGHLVDEGVLHLAGQGALPDQLVEAPLLLGEMGDDLRRQAADGGGADGLVGLLGVLGLGLVAARLIREVIGAVALGHVAADLLQGLVGQVDRVGAHVGNQAHGPAADVHPLVELLGDAHGALGGEAELARRLLLEGGGDKGRRRVALALLALDTLDAELPPGGSDQALFHRPRPGLVADGELLDLVTLILNEPPLEGLALLGGIGEDRPVLPGLEGLDLLLALDDQAQGRALHPPGGEAAAYLLPQQGGEVEAHQVVQGTARLLGIDQVGGQLPGMGHCLLDGALGDLVEHHPVDRPLAELAAALEQFVQVPGDGLPLPVRVRRQIEAGGVLELAGDGLNVLLVALDNLVLHGEARRRVHRPLFGHQITHMAVGGQDLKVRAEVFLDGFGLGGGFDDDQIHG